MVEKPISPDQIVQEVMDRWPQTIMVFLEHRMNCVGCSMAAFEVLREALDIYHLPVAPFVEELNQMISQTKEASEEQMDSSEPSE